MRYYFIIYTPAADRVEKPVFVMHIFSLSNLLCLSRACHHHHRRCRRRRRRCEFMKREMKLTLPFDGEKFHGEVTLHLNYKSTKKSSWRQMCRFLQKYVYLQCHKNAVCKISSLSLKKLSFYGCIFKTFFKFNFT